LILQCEKCLRRYSVAEEMVRGKAVKLRCKGCQHIISVPRAPRGGAPRRSSNSQRRASAAPKQNAGVPWDGLSAVTRPTESGALWFAMVKGRQSGPLQSKELPPRVSTGEIGRRTYVWREGMTDWKRAEDLPELSWIFEPDGGGAASAGAEAANHLRESFEESKEVVQERPLPGLRLSPELLAAAPEVAAEQESRRSTASQPAGEATRYFIAEAGMNRRNPPWKIAAFAAGLTAIPAALLYLLAAFKVGPLVVTRVDTSGHEVKESIFSSDGVSRLRDLLAGRKQTRKLTTSRVAAKSPGPTTKAAGAAPANAKSPPAGSADLKALYADSSHVDVGPTLRRQQGKEKDNAGGLAPADVAKVVAQSQPAFQFCIEQEMKKNPSFNGGKIFINAVVGSSGTVKQAAISRPDIDASSLGDCLKGKARRMVFASFSGDDTEVQIPLILTTSL
jgi:predicted Zn finger-like uncharacterized protein